MPVLQVRDAHPSPVTPPSPGSMQCPEGGTHSQPERGIGDQPDSRSVPGRSPGFPGLAGVSVMHAPHSRQGLGQPPLEPFPGALRLSRMGERRDKGDAGGCEQAPGG